MRLFDVHLLSRCTSFLPFGLHFLALKLEYREQPRSPPCCIERVEFHACLVTSLYARNITNNEEQDGDGCGEGNPEENKNDDDALHELLQGSTIIFSFLVKKINPCYDYHLLRAPKERTLKLPFCSPLLSLSDSFLVLVSS